MRAGGGPDRLGAVVGQCWVAFCVGLLLVGAGVAGVADGASAGFGCVRW